MCEGSGGEVMCLRWRAHIRDGVGKEIAEEIFISQALAAKQAKLIQALFECMPVFPLSHACIVTDRFLISFYLLSTLVIINS